MIIRGTDIKRDLPTGSQIEISLVMDLSQQVRAQAYINSLDEDFEVSFDPQMKHKALDELRNDVRQEKERLAGAREKAERTEALKATSIVAQIHDRQLIEQIDTLLDAAEQDRDAVAQLDRRLRELAAEIDHLEDSVEWPLLLEKAAESRGDTERIVGEFGDAADRNRLGVLKVELQRAIDSGDADVLRQCMETLWDLFIQVVNRQPGFHVGQFNWLVDQTTAMRDRAQAEQIIAQGRRALNNNDVEALKAANRQLLSLLPREVQERARHANVGSTVTRGA